MNVLVACEYSGTVRDAFIRKGHNAWSCDLLPTEREGPHFQKSVLEVIGLSWDLIIAHPPCTDLSVSGARWWPEKRADGRQQAAVDFFWLFTQQPCAWAIENPVGLMSSVYRKPDQIIQPWQFGHGETKATCLWLHRLPLLRPSCIVAGRANLVHRMAPGPDRWKDRSRTFTGIASAMAEQWSTL